MSIRAILIGAALGAAFLVVGSAATAQAADDSPDASVVEIAPQIDTAVDDSRVEVQTWTIFAAAAAAGGGLLVFMVRVVMGWMKPPPPQEESPHERGSLSAEAQRSGSPRAYEGRFWVRRRL